MTHSSRTHTTTHATGTHSRAHATTWAQRITTSVALAILATSTAPAPATAETTTPQTAQTGTPGADERGPLNKNEVAAQLAQAEKLRTQLAQQNAQLAAASQRLDAAAAAATTAMEKYADAKRALEAAISTEKTEREKLRQLSQHVTDAKRDVEAMAIDAYTNGNGSLADLAAIIKVATGTRDQLSAATLSAYLADTRNSQREHYTSLAQRQQTAATAAATARITREKATTAAAAAKAAADATVATHQAAATALAAQVAATRGKIAATESTPTDAAAAAALAQREAADALSNSTSCSTNNTTYPNGLFPDSALCPLATAPGHKLRPSAASAFDRMSTAYRKETGNYLCVSDSYRSLAEQVDIRRRKPNLAAVPGQSHHGLGIAIDLCGGIENFGTIAYQWMKQNAPLYGFYHPTWAEPTGSKPEPWHWEYAN
ncbi:D-alanyl-D-alanine carboxypeptidase family protein [Dermatophilus congolensis]|uniref:D-alanyl-D-alanine carboxypeptidase family protein n=1 Tax=Dermatophilus congolensis TaxID=1863 RepID=UPI001AAFC6E1|nr:hypothetical protein [Dermatophilus congolensis]MBO3131961.1 hypothetical protein [Dermatophilus congolensis]MBO3133883.1 hypothetical protein [Dermatophilus congolensis]MBO3136113.1 hypothetical protein [Dermatophilus congolensis]MBO3138357.1 hypothetical protein [Dermatophilus congolensis]